MMKERPEKWEVVCKKCLAGMIMSDDEVRRRLGRESTWPKHHGSAMQLRHIFVPRKKETLCSQFGCRHAAISRCSCNCLGKFHGVDNPQKNYVEASVVSPAWYHQPIREYISLRKNEQG